MSFHPNCMIHKFLFLTTPSLISNNSHSQSEKTFLLVIKNNQNQFIVYKNIQPSIIVRNNQENKNHVKQLIHTSYNCSRREYYIDRQTPSITSTRRNSARPLPQRPSFRRNRQGRSQSLWRWYICPHWIRRKVYLA